MLGFIAAIIGAVLVAGIIALVEGLRKVPPPAPSRPGQRKSSLWQKLTPREQIIAIVSFAVGVVAALLSGWVILIGLLPVVCVGVPRLLSNKSLSTRTDRLQALEDWTRSLAGVLVAGFGIEQAILASRGAAPAAIAKEVSALCTRLTVSNDTPGSLRAFARELDDPTGDLVALMMIEAAQVRGTALSDQLVGIAMSVSEDVRARRQVLAAQKEPQETARLMTIISFVFIGLFAINGDFLAPYKSFLGHIALVVLASVFGYLLYLMRQIATPAPPPRILGPAARTPDQRSAK